MPPQPKPFRLVHRAFDRIEFDPAKSAEVFETRGFDLAFISGMFPAYVLERQDNRHRERRYQVIGELLGEVYLVVYTPRDTACRLITARLAEQYERELWFAGRT